MRAVERIFKAQREHPSYALRGRLEVASAVDPDRAGREWVFSKIKAKVPASVGTAFVPFEVSEELFGADVDKLAEMERELHRLFHGKLFFSKVGRIHTAEHVKSTWAGDMGSNARVTLTWSGLVSWKGSL